MTERMTSVCRQSNFWNVKLTTVTDQWPRRADRIDAGVCRCWRQTLVLRQSVWSVTYVLWLNGASYRKTLKKQIGTGIWRIEWSHDQ